MRKTNKTFYDYLSFIQSVGNKNRKENLVSRKLTLYSPVPLYEKNAFADYLANMAKKGWIFTDFKKSGLSDSYKSRQWLVFAKGEDRNIKYCLDAFRAAGEPAAGEYIAACEAAGWKFTARTGDIYIFSSEHGEPEPLQSDNAVEAETMELFRPSLRELLTASGIFFAVTALYVFFSVRIYITDPLTYYLSNALIIGIPLLLIAGGILLIEKILSLIQFNRAMKCYRMAVRPEQHDYRRLVNISRTSGIVTTTLTFLALITILASSMSTQKYAEVSCPISLSDFIPTSRYIGGEDEYYRKSILAEEIGYSETNSYSMEEMKITRYEFISRAAAADAYDRDPIKNEGEWTEQSEKFCNEHKVFGAKYRYDEHGGFWYCFGLKNYYYKLYFYQVPYVERYAGAIIEEFRR